MSPTIRIGQDTYEHLQEHAEPLIDTPDSVIRRLLGLEADEQVETATDEAAVAVDASVSRLSRKQPRATALVPPGPGVRRRRAGRSRAGAGARPPNVEHGRRAAR